MDKCSSSNKKGKNYGLYDLNPFIPNGMSLYYQLEQSISVLRDEWYFFPSNFDKKCCKQTVQTLIRRRILKRLLYNLLVKRIKNGCHQTNFFSSEQKIPLPPHILRIIQYKTLWSIFFCHSYQFILLVGSNSFL